MDPEKLRAISSKAGKSAHAKGTANRFTKADASALGRRGGIASGKKRAARKKAAPPDVLKTDGAARGGGPASSGSVADGGPKPARPFAGKVGRHLEDLPVGDDPKAA
jgi:hypothetical protein